MPNNRDYGEIPTAYIRDAVHSPLPCTSLPPLGRDVCELQCFTAASVNAEGCAHLKAGICPNPSASTGINRTRSFITLKALMDGDHGAPQARQALRAHLQVVTAGAGWFAGPHSGGRWMANQIQSFRRRAPVHLPLLEAVLMSCGAQLAERSP